MRRFFILVVMTTSLLSGCAEIIKEMGVTDYTTERDLANAERLAKRQKYAEAIAIYDRIAKQSAKSEAGAHALFASAEIMTYYDNPGRDYQVAVQKFDDFVRLYPKNEKVHHARNWRSVLKNVLEARRDVQDIKKENERLTKSIEDLKRIDIQHEERRRR